MQVLVEELIMTSSLDGDNENDEKGFAFAKY